MNKHAIHHISDLPYAYPKDENTLVVRIRCARGDMERVSVVYKDRYDWVNRGKAKEMELISETELFSVYEAELQVPRNRYRYYFELIDSEGNTIYYDERGFRFDDAGPNEVRAFQFPYIAPKDLYLGKKTLEEAVVYQIFPDRFYNGDTSNDPEGTAKWGGIPGRIEMFGGDIKGITQKIPYLKKLGINLIYLTPVFLSSSNHKYNTKDYYQIDPQFGNVEDARELVSKCHDNGIKIVFDAVFNHTGSDFFAFKDLLKNQEDSEYKNWYHPDSFPVLTITSNYYTFADRIYTMPKLRTENEAVREYFFEVGRYWIREIGIDGWRLDVCDEVDHSFWQGFKKAIEEVNPEAILIGEIMHESSAFLKGNELDSIMNYPFKNAMTEYFAKRIMNKTEFMDTLSDNRNLYTDIINRQLWNLLDSHDTSRFLTESRGEVARLKLAMAFQFTYIGTPYIYYGDEIGLDGGHDPYCRRCMIWDEEDMDLDLLDHVKNLISFRKSSEALKYGKFRELSKDSFCIVTERTFGAESIISVFNNSDYDREILLPEGEYTEVTPSGIYKTAGKEVKKQQIPLKPMTYRIFRSINND
ncbi:MAG: glycoside hydrolase family 13 protein [Clostridiaceae bacterium]